MFSSKEYKNQSGGPPSKVRTQAIVALMVCNDEHEAEILPNQRAALEGYTDTNKSRVLLGISERRDYAEALNISQRTVNIRSFNRRHDSEHLDQRTRHRITS